jgi:hypothetical protein
LRNWGKTRAERVEMTHLLGIKDRTIRDSEKPKPITIASGSIVTTLPLNIRDATSESDWASITAGNEKLHFWGYISYWDVFGKHHCHVWDSVYVPKTKCDFGMVDIYNIEECPKYNTY